MTVEEKGATFGTRSSAALQLMVHAVFYTERKLDWIE